MILQPVLLLAHPCLVKASGKRNEGRKRGAAHAETGLRRAVGTDRNIHHTSQQPAEQKPFLAFKDERTGRKNLSSKSHSSLCCRARGAQTWLLMQSLSHAGVTMGTPPRATADCTCACTHECMFVCRIHGVCPCTCTHSSTRNRADRQTDRQGERAPFPYACAWRAAERRAVQCRAGCECGQG